MTDERFSWLAPMTLWPYALSLLPPPPVRPQGGGAPRQDDRAVFAAVVFVVATGTPWRSLPKLFGVSWQNSHRRFVEWTSAGVWVRLRLSTQDDEAAGAAREWAAILAQNAETRLREPRYAAPAAAIDGTAGSKSAPGWRRPTVRQVHHTLADRLFGARTQ
ncbi:transposase [Dactylosporangium sp. NPDC051484]|uniref:transposase n=1 Tax=Dactylosporangium sp. NPDC051484 TaxID=3154942 RepID=UPI00344B543B